jgi:hypothetical protein
MIDALALLPTARAIRIDAVARPTYARLELPQEVDAGDDGAYRSLRVVDDRNEEVAYALDPTVHAPAPRPAILGDLGYVRGRYTEAILDAGDSGVPYDAIALETSEATFFNRVEIAISDDRATWRVTRDDALIYRVRETDAGSQTIAISPARARWLRVRVFGPERFPLDGATVARGAANAPAIHRLRGLTNVSHRARTTTIAFDFGTANVEVAALQFDAVQPEFVRNVTVEASDDAVGWRRVSDGSIARYAYGAPHLTVDARGDRARYWRAIVDDEDDRPVNGLRATAYTTTRALAFEALPRRTYRLQWGAGEIAPTYDLRDRLDHDEPVAYAGAYAGEPRAPLVPRAPKARSGKPSVVLALAFCAALLALGGITFATLRGVPRQS